MMKMSRLQPQLKQLELACGGDKQKLQQEQMALYKEEGVSMFGGCLWSFLPLLFLLPLYTVIREPLKYLMHLDEDVITKLSEKATAALGEGKRLSAYWQYDYAKDIQTMGAGIVPADVESLNFSFLGIDLGKVPSWHIWEAKSWSDVGGFLLPVISGALSWLTMFVSQKMNNTVVRDENGEQTDAAASSTQTNKVMNLLMPLMSVVFGFMWPLGLSIYWLAQSAFGIVQDVVLTKHYRKVYDAEDKVKRQKAAERAAEEAEKERIRAARRAANPDGITENTSKKKQQLRALQILIFRQKFLRQLHRHRAHPCGIQHMKILLRGCFHHENIHTQKFGIYLPIHSRHTMRKQPLHVLTDFPFIGGHCRRTAFRSFL